MRGIITVVGKDMVGILAKVSGVCAKNGVNVISSDGEIIRFDNAGRTAQGTSE